MIYKFSSLVKIDTLNVGDIFEGRNGKQYEVIQPSKKYHGMWVKPLDKDLGKVSFYGSAARVAVLTKEV